MQLGGVQHAKGLVAEMFPDVIPPWTPFEWDRVRIDVQFGNRRGPRGPVRTTAMVGKTQLDVAAGVVRRDGFTQAVELERQARGPVFIRDWVVDEGDPLGLFRRRFVAARDEMTLLLPHFTSLRSEPLVRDLETMSSAPRAGYGTEVFGVREYRPGDSLRRIHWRSTARRGELIVREFEPPGVQNLGIFLDPSPIDDVAADQIARIAASEAWDCLRVGGRVTLWAPGCEPTRPDEDRNLLALLEWLARYPTRARQDEPAPLVGDAIAVTSTSDARVLDAVEDVRAHGGAVRAWVVGDAVLESDIDVERAGFEWPL